MMQEGALTPKPFGQATPTVPLSQNWARGMPDKAFRLPFSNREQELGDKVDWLKRSGAATDGC